MDNFEKRLIISALKDCIKQYRKNEDFLVLIINGLRFVGIGIKPYIKDNSLFINTDICNINIPFEEINEVLLFDIYDEETTVFI